LKNQYFIKPLNTIIMQEKMTWESSLYHRGNYALYTDTDKLLAEIVPTSERGYYNVFYKGTKHLIASEVKGVAKAKKIAEEWVSKMFWNANSFLLLKAVAKHSTNTICQRRAMALLNPSDYDVDLKLRVMRGDGSFMSACYRGDIFDAWIKADGSNRKALEQSDFDKGILRDLIINH